MRRRQTVIVSILLILAFGGGAWVGSRVAAGRRLPSSPIVMMLAQSSRAPAAPAAAGSPACVDIRNAGPLIGKTGCVAGLVLRAFSARSGNTFLDFCQDYRACPFTSVIFASDKDKFGDLGTLEGKRVEIRGDVISYQDHAEIVIRDPRQVRGAP